MANAARITERGSDGIAFEAATPASQPGDTFPAGVVLDFAGSAAPTGWLICDGSLVARATYPQLLAVLTAAGFPYGSGDGSTTMGIPDARGRSIVGKHTSGTFTTLGAQGGEENHTISAGELPVHNHSFSGSGSTDSQGTHNHSIPDAYLLNVVQVQAGANVNIGTQPSTVGFRNAGTGIVNNAGAHAHNVSVSGTTNNAGSGAAGNNMHPYLVLNKIIRAY